MSSGRVFQSLGPANVAETIICNTHRNKQRYLFSVSNSESGLLLYSSDEVKSPRLREQGRQCNEHILLLVSRTQASRIKTMTRSDSQKTSRILENKTRSSISTTLSTTSCEETRVWIRGLRCQSGQRPQVFFFVARVY